jgi:Flp pilus assembly protein TadB
MGAVDLLLHGLAFVLPAWCVALCTTLAAAVGQQGRGVSWWWSWLLSGLAGVIALCVALWLTGHDGSMLGYAALVLSCASVSWLLSMRRA